MSLGITVMLYTLKLTWLVTLYLVLASGFRNHMLVGSRYTYERECSDTVLDYESLRSIAQTNGLTINVQDYIMFLNVQIQREDCTLGHLSAFVQPGGILHLGINSGVFLYCSWFMLIYSLPANCDRVYCSDPS